MTSSRRSSQPPTSTAADGTLARDMGVDERAYGDDVEVEDDVRVDDHGDPVRDPVHDPVHDPIAEQNVALRRRVADLERSLAERDRDRARDRFPRALSTTIHWRWLALWLLLTTLAAAGPLLVVTDRWLDVASVRQLARGLWCRSTFLCASALPAYFALVGLASATLIAVALALRPSPDAFRADDGPPIPTESLGPPKPARPFAAIWHRYGERFVGLAVLQLALLSALYGLYGAREPVLAPLVVAAGAAWCVRSELRRAGPAFWLTALALILGAHNMNAWWFAVVGDEYGYYDLARDVALHMPLTTALGNLLDSNWSFGSYPFGSTFIQATFMRLFGTGNFGWRIGSIGTAALSLPLLAVFYGGFMRRGVAVAALAFLASSHYLMSFGKIGYDNLQALLAMALVLAAATWSIRSRTRSAAAGLGIAVGLCFYVFPGALFAPLIGALLVLCMDRPYDRGALRRWALAGGVALAAAAPMLAQATFWSEQRVGMLRHNSALTAAAAPGWRDVAHNVLYALATPFYTVDESHFVAVGHLDPLTAGFMALGVACAIGIARRDGFARFLLLAYAVSAVLVGALHGKATPPNTRMFLLLPWYAAFAAIGLAWSGALAARAWPALAGRRPRSALAAVVLIAALALNLYQADVLSRRRLAGRYQPPPTTFMRLAMAEADRRGPDAVGPTYLIVHHPQTLYVGSLRKLIAVYGLPLGPGQVIGVDVGPEQDEARTPIDALTAARLSDPDTLAIIPTDVGAAQRAPFEAALQASGKHACEWRNEAKQPTFVVWLGGAYDGLCVPP